MIRIAVCDDEAYFRSQISELCHKFYQEDDRITEFSEGESLLAAAKKESFDIIFLDIEMEHLNGIDLKNMLEQQNPDSYIIFVTAYPEFVMNAFGKNVCGFLEKPVSSDRLFPLLEKIQNYASQNRILTILDSVDGMIQIAEKKIVYLQAEHVYSRLILESKETILVRKTLKDWESILNPSSFYRIHKSYIVNFEHVAKIGSAVILTDHTQLPIGRTKLPQVRQLYHEFLRKNARLI